MSAEKAAKAAEQALGNARGSCISLHFHLFTIAFSVCFSTSLFYRTKNARLSKYACPQII